MLTGDSGCHRVQGAALAQCENRCPACHRLNRDDAEVLYSRHQQGAAPPVHVQEHVVGGGAQERGLGSRDVFKVFTEPSFPQHHQAAVGPLRGPDGEVRTLVRDQPARAQIEVFTPDRWVGREAVDTYRWADHRRRQSPPVTYPLGHGV
ncbi:Uncharacterised protein [Mycobacteroides abscessus subsp. abscessus]|nr:Uncharacterised protein [Mycobacteroides abscessus subsp. abscessus]